MTTPNRTSRPRPGQYRPVPTGRAARTRTGNHMSVARRHAVLDATVTRMNTGLVTTADYLADVIGADAAFVASYAGPFGKAVAKVWREKTGTEPAKTGMARRGTRLLSVFAYGTDELPILMAGAVAYRRTAALLGPAA